MAARAGWIASASVFSLVLVALSAGCAPRTEGVRLPPRSRVARVSRTASERQRLIRPPAHRLHGDLFDTLNEQIIREDRDVGTVFLGDSITEAWALDVFFTPALGELIVNRGISGDTAAGLSQRFEADVLQLRPRNVAILIGTNDVVRLTDEGKSAEVIENEVIATIEAMVDQAKEAGINVLLGSILPTAADAGKHGAHPEIRTAINARLAELCRAKSIVYVDYAAAMSDAQGRLREGLARDGLHPDWPGLRIMADVLMKAVKANGLRL